MPRRCFRPKSCTWKRRWEGDEGGQWGQPQHQGSALPSWDRERGARAGVVCWLWVLGLGTVMGQGAGEGSLSRM